MKKFLSILLVLCLLLGASSALAQTVTTELMKLENGVTIVLHHDDTLQISSAEIDLPNYGFWLIENGQNAAVSLNIAPSEIDGELSLGDLTEEQQLQYAQQVGEMFDKIATVSGENTTVTFTISADVDDLTENIKKYLK